MKMPGYDFSNQTVIIASLAAAGMSIGFALWTDNQWLAAINRYAICLREAAKLKVTSKKLVAELLQGGVNKFFLSRPEGEPRARGSNQMPAARQADQALQERRNHAHPERNVEGFYDVLKIIGGVAA